MVKIYVGNVPTHARAADVRCLFEKYGMVTECDVIKNYAFIHFTNVHDANAAIDGLDDCEFMGNTIHVEMSKNQNHKPGPRRDNMRNDGRNDGPPPMQMPPAGYSMPGMPYVPPPPHMPPAGYGMPPMQMSMPGAEGSGYNAAAAGGTSGSSAPSSAYPGYPPPYGMPYPPPPMPVFSSEQFKEYFKRYGCLPPLPPMYGSSTSHSSRRRSRSRSDSRSPRRSSRRSHSRSPRRSPPRSREYREYERGYSPRRERRYSRSPRR